MVLVLTMLIQMVQLFGMLLQILDTIMTLQEFLEMTTLTIFKNNLKVLMAQVLLL